jgi:hypothetical protein
MRRMSTPDEHLGAALRKVKLYQMNQWVGNLTPPEAKALVNAGAIAAHHDIAWINSGLQAGSEGVRWIYFAASPALRALLRARTSRCEPVKTPVET